MDDEGRQERIPYDRNGILFFAETHRNGKGIPEVEVDEVFNCAYWKEDIRRVVVVDIPIAGVFKARIKPHHKVFCFVACDGNVSEQLNTAIRSHKSINNTPRYYCGDPSLLDDDTRAMVKQLPPVATLQGDSTDVGTD